MARPVYACCCGDTRLICIEPSFSKRRSERLHSSGKHRFQVFAGAAEDERTEVFVPVAVRSERLGGDTTGS